MDQTPNVNKEINIYSIKFTMTMVVYYKSKQALKTKEKKVNEYIRLVQHEKKNN
jgi:hypothetical protein